MTKHILLSLAMIVFPVISKPQTQEPVPLNTEKVYTEFNDYIAQYGKDKMLHFYAGFTLTYANGDQSEYLIGPIMDGQLAALQRGIEKEFDDVGVSYTNRQAIYKEIENMRESNRKLWNLIKPLKLDEGDLLADFGGASLGGAILSMHQYILIDSSTNAVHN